MAIVEIDPTKAENHHLGNCVVNVISVIEMKYKNYRANSTSFIDDVNKVLTYLDSNNTQTKYYLAFIWEKYFDSEDIVRWFDGKKAATVKGKVTELYAVGSMDKDCMYWKIEEY